MILYLGGNEPDKTLKPWAESSLGQLLKFYLGQEKDQTKKIRIPIGTNLSEGMQPIADLIKIGDRLGGLFTRTKTQVWPITAPMGWVSSLFNKQEMTL